MPYVLCAWCAVGDGKHARGCYFQRVTEYWEAEVQLMANRAALCRARQVIARFHQINRTRRTLAAIAQAEPSALLSPPKRP